MTKKNQLFQLSYNYITDRLFLAALFFLLITMLDNIVNAAETPNLAKPNIVVPEKISGVATLSAKQVLEELMSEHPPLLIDARIKQDRDHGYIESSISLPDINTNCESLSLVAVNKKKPLIFYCNGIQCGRSVVSIKIARSCGYHQLSWFRGGFAEWKEKGYQYITHK